jgi:hypothetical protein
MSYTSGILDSWLWPNLLVFWALGLRPLSSAFRPRALHNANFKVAQKAPTFPL